MKNPWGVQPIEVVMLPHEFLSLVSNVDPALKDDMMNVFTPQGSGPVATSPHFIYIVCNILRGLSPVEISMLVEREKKTFVSQDAVREYSLMFVPPKLVLPSMKQKWLSQRESLDEIALLENLCQVQMMRIMDRLDKPAVDAEDEESKRRDIDVMRKLAMDTLKAKVDTGRYQKPAEPPTKVDVTVTQQGQITHAHVVDPMAPIDSRVAAAALQAITKIQGLAAPKKPDEGDGSNN